MKFYFKVTITHVNSRGHEIGWNEMDIGISAGTAKAAVEMVETLLKPIKRVKIEYTRKGE